MERSRAEDVRVERLLDAEHKAAQLFDEIERRAMIRPGITEKELSDRIHDLAGRMFGVTRHWHRRIVRAGENTLQPFHERPPDRMIVDDDIVFLDLGPIFEEWEADFGRTFLLGDDPHKRAIRDALPRVWRAGRDYFAGHPDVTGAELFDFVVGVAHAEGFEWASRIAGHLVGSSRTRRSPARASSGTSCPDRTSRCAARIRAAASATGSSRSTSSTAHAVSGGSTSSSSICPSGGSAPSG